MTFSPSSFKGSVDSFTGAKSWLDMVLTGHNRPKILPFFNRIGSKHVLLKYNNGTGIWLVEFLRSRVTGQSTSWSARMRNQVSMNICLISPFLSSHLRSHGN